MDFQRTSTETRQYGSRQYEPLYSRFRQISEEWEIKKMMTMLRKKSAALLLVPLILLFSQIIIASNEAKGKMKSQINCAKDSIARTSCIIKAVLEDIKANYRRGPGGGISEIKFTTTNTCTVAILQEEQPDVLTYDAELKSNGQIQVKKRDEISKPK